MAKSNERMRTTIPPIDLPPYRPPTPEELAARRQIMARANRLREKVGRLPYSLTEWIHQERESQ